jgi:hypothetical protein
MSAAKRLMPDGNGRWTANQKKLLLVEIRSGADLRETLRVHDVSADEYLEWVRVFDEHGYQALKTTKLQKFRVAERRPRKPRQRHVRAQTE